MSARKPENFRKWIEDAVRRLKSEMSGVAAVEFALVFPLMLLLYMGTMELSVAVSVDRKMARIASAVGDLVGQSDATLSGEDAKNILDIASRIMHPYEVKPTTVVSFIEVADGYGRVLWSCARNGTADNYLTVLPDSLKIPKTYLIRTRVSLNYRPFIGWAEYSEEGVFNITNATLPLEEVIYQRPRITRKIDLEGNC